MLCHKGSFFWSKKKKRSWGSSILLLEKKIMYCPPASHSALQRNKPRGVHGHGSSTSHSVSLPLKWWVDLEEGTAAGGSHNRDPHLAGTCEGCCSPSCVYACICVRAVVLALVCLCLCVGGCTISPGAYNWWRMVDCLPACHSSRRTEVLFLL